jgi:hypothetical protein
VDSRLYRNLPVVLTPLGCANARAFVRCARSGVAVLLASGKCARICDRGGGESTEWTAGTVGGVFEMQNAPDHGWSGAFWDVVFGGVLLSHTLSSAVPSALEGLASGFGMGPGVSPPLWPP